MKLQNKVTILFALATIALVVTNCKKDSSTNAGNTLDSTNPITTVDANELFLQYVVSPTDWATWNNHDMSTDSVQALMKQATKKMYTTWSDAFDFVFFILNNTELPTGRPSGQTIPLRNTVGGIGLPTTLNNADTYGSPKQLQSVMILYKIANNQTSTNSYLWTGPSAHELGHRWINFAIHGGSPHWPSYTIDGTYTSTGGIFAAATNNYAPVELYLMGLIDGNEITDPTNLNLYNQIVTAQGVRSPTKANSQKAFRGAVIVVTPQELTADQIAMTNKGVTNFTKSDGSVTQGVNFWRQTGGRATINLALNDVKK